MHFKKLKPITAQSRCRPRLPTPASYQQYLSTNSALKAPPVAAKWRQRRCATIKAAILDVTMDRMGAKMVRELAAIPHSVRTALGYVEQHGQDGALARIACDEARHPRTWRRALKLPEFQQQNRDRQEAAAGHQNKNLPNEPKPHLTPVISIIRNTSSPALKPAGPQGRTGGRIPKETSE